MCLRTVLSYLSTLYINKGLFCKKCSLQMLIYPVNCPSCTSFSFCICAIVVWIYLRKSCVHMLCVIKTKHLVRIGDILFQCVYCAINYHIDIHARLVLIADNSFDTDTFTGNILHNKVGLLYRKQKLKFTCYIFVN